MTLRRKGNSIGSIETALGVPRSTLSGWFKRIALSSQQEAVLKERRRLGLEHARAKASAWHRLQKAQRISSIEESAAKMIEGLNILDSNLLEIALSFLYLGEGAKKKSQTALGSSDPRIARFYVESLKALYAVPNEKIKCHLHLRADQDSETLKEYWSKMLDLPFENFGKTSFDARTEGRPTYRDYKGVCLINCGRVEIQRRLLYIANGFCDRVIQRSAEL